MFDAEVAAISYAIEIVYKEGTSRPVIFSDSQAAILRFRSLNPGPGQRHAIRANQYIKGGEGMKATLKWCPGHKGIEGNKRADACTKEAGLKEEDTRFRGMVSISKIQWKIKEKVKMHNNKELAKLH